MNKERIIELADFLYRLDNPRYPNLGFNMEHWFCASECQRDYSGNSCGTVACVAGWAALAYGKNPQESYYQAGIRILGLEINQATRLFSPLNSGYKATNKQAAATLLHLAKTGEVDWGADPDLYPRHEDMQKTGNQVVENT